MSHLWSLLVTRFSPFVLFTMWPTVLVNLTYAVGALLCLSFDYIPSFRQYKVQARYNSGESQIHCLKTLVLIKLAAEIPMTAGAYPTFKLLGIRYDLPLPSALTVLATIVASFFVEDAWHYVGHRLLHTKWGYRKIHYMHHKYATPIGLAANYAHPAETMFLGFGTILPIFILRPHLFTIGAWVVARQAQAIAVHCGYDFPWAPGKFLPLVGGARFHDRHHTNFKKNFAPLFTYLDDLFGTDDHGPRRTKGERGVAGGAEAGG